MVIQERWSFNAVGLTRGMVSNQKCSFKRDDHFKRGGVSSKVVLKEGSLIKNFINKEVV